MPHIEQIDEWAFRDLLNQLDSDQNGVVSKVRGLRMAFAPAGLWQTRGALCGQGQGQAEPLRRGWQSRRRARAA